MKKGKILIVDDNEDILFTLKMLLRPLAEQVTTLDDPREMLPLLSRVRHDVILLDMNFRRDAVSGREGFAWLEEILKLDPQAVVIFITAYSDTEKAVQAIKQGATDFIPKPWQNDKLLATVSAALQLSFSRHEVTVLKEQKKTLEQRAEALATPAEPTRIIGESAAMQALLQTVRKCSDTDANLLLLGENGTGKDLLARYIYEQSPRRSKPYVAIDLGSIPEPLFESELFGYEKGAFTDAHALPERDRQPQSAHAGQTALRHRAAACLAPGFHNHLSCGRATDMRHQHRPVCRHRPTRVPPGPPLSYQYHRTASASSARTGRRPLPTGRLLRAALCPQISQRDKGHRP